MKFRLSLPILALLLVSCAGTAKRVERAGTPGYRLWEYKTQHVNMYSLKDEITLGEEVQKLQIESFNKKKVPVDPPAYAPLKKRIETIVKRLTRESDMPSLPYEVHIYDKPDVVNAFCMPGGKIGVFTGLVDKEKGLVRADDDSEIAAVLSHEIAHATLRHVSRRLTAMQGLNLFGGVLSLGIGHGAGAPWQNAFNQVFATGAQLYFPTYTRNHEMEADQVGFYYLAKAGYDPQAAIRVWERMALKAHEKGKSERTHFLSTHPGSADRADFLKAYLPDVEEVKKHRRLVEESKRER